MMHLFAAPAVRNGPRRSALYQRVRIDTIQIKKKQRAVYQSRLQKLLELTKKRMMYGQWHDGGLLKERKVSGRGLFFILAQEAKGARALDWQRGKRVLSRQYFVRFVCFSLE